MSQSTPTVGSGQTTSPDRAANAALFSCEPPLEPETNLVWFSLDSIFPSPENELLYKPIVPTDPDIRALAASIQKNGLREPIVITRDRFILSGHRRYAACKLLGMKRVKCTVQDISRDDPLFEVFLREYNRQRVKSFDEIVRETIVDFNPKAAYQALINERKEASRVSGEFIEIKGTKTRAEISRAKQAMLDAALRVIYDQREYWPLSDRVIHYELLNDPPLMHSSKPGSRYKNNPRCYADLCDLLTRGRLAGLIPMNAIGDKTRSIATWHMNRTAGLFIKNQIDTFLTGYCRDYQQSQPNHIEIVGEKNTIEGSIRPVALEHCIPYTIGRGFCSLPPRYEMSQRFKKSGKEKLIVLILSDFDPDGECIAHSFARSMRDDFGVDVQAKQVCLTYDQVKERDLPQTFDIKKTSPRYKAFSRKYGDRAHELEAISSAERSRLLTVAIEEVLDIDAYNAELEAEEEDAAKIERLRMVVGPALLGALGENGGVS
jgi:hypothetical protein